MDFALSVKTQKIVQKVLKHKKSLSQKKNHKLKYYIEHSSSEFNTIFFLSLALNYLQGMLACFEKIRDNLSRWDIVSLWWEESVSLCSRGSKRSLFIGRERRHGKEIADTSPRECERVSYTFDCSSLGDAALRARNDNMEMAVCTFCPLSILLVFILDIII